VAPRLKFSFLTLEDGDKNVYKLYNKFLTLKSPINNKFKKFSVPQKRSGNLYLKNKKVRDVTNSMLM